MEQTLSVNGVSVVTIDENNRVMIVQFLPDDEFAPLLEQSSGTSGTLQLLRNGSFDYVANKPRIRANSTLLRKAAHGRLSATRDGATQLTLKAFAIEAIDWPRAFVRETVGIMTDLMGSEKMSALLSELLDGLKVRNYGKQV